MVYMIQCLCPKRHAIMAVAFEPTDVSVEEMQRLFPQQIEAWIASGVIRRRCEMSRTDVELHYETGRTPFRNMEEAKPIMEAAEQAQLRTVATWNASRN